jgi:hypothetical protein
MKRRCTYFLTASLIAVFMQAGISFGQGSPKQKIAVFAPLFLDSAFDASNNYRYDKNFPKFINPGLEFYEGVQLALDSLNKEKAELEVFVFDTRSTQRNLLEQINEIDTAIGLIIAHANAQENWVLAGEAKLRKIPYVNVNLPNDGGVVDNPYFVMLNPTLKTHIEGVYLFLQKHYSKNSIVVFRKKGQMEDVIKNYLEDFGKTSAAGSLKLKYVDLIDSFTVQQLIPLLDSNKYNTVLAASLDDNFNRRLINKLASAKSYKTIIVGMPTFGNLEKEFSKTEFKGPEIIYGDPFYNPRTNKVSVDITNHFNTKFYARPSDMVMRGFETALRFSKLMMKFKGDFAANISTREFNVFREFEIQPNINKTNNLLDYYENKKLYFVHLQDGVVKLVN